MTHIIFLKSNSLNTWCTEVFNWEVICFIFTASSLPDKFHSKNPNFPFAMTVTWLQCLSLNLHLSLLEYLRVKFEIYMSNTKLYHKSFFSWLFNLLFPDFKLGCLLVFIMKYIVKEINKRLIECWQSNTNLTRPFLNFWSSYEDITSALKQSLVRKEQEQHWVWHYTADKCIYMGSHSLLGSKLSISCKGSNVNLQTAVGAILVFVECPKSIASVVLVVWRPYQIVKSIQHVVFNLLHSQAISCIGYNVNLQTAVATILVFVECPKSIASKVYLSGIKAISKCEANQTNGFQDITFTSNCERTGQTDRAIPQYIRLSMGL